MSKRRPANFTPKIDPRFAGSQTEVDGLLTPEKAIPLPASKPLSLDRAKSMNDAFAATMKATNGGHDSRDGGQFYIAGVIKDRPEPMW